MVVEHDAQFENIHGCTMEKNTRGASLRFGMEAKARTIGYKRSEWPKMLEPGKKA